jgi:hypothetical protein
MNSGLFGEYALRAMSAISEIAEPFSRLGVGSTDQTNLGQLTYKMVKWVVRPADEWHSIRKQSHVVGISDVQYDPASKLCFMRVVATWPLMYSLLDAVTKGKSVVLAAEPEMERVLLIPMCHEQAIRGARHWPGGRPSVDFNFPPEEVQIRKMK